MPHNNKKIEIKKALEAKTIQAESARWRLPCPGTDEQRHDRGRALGRRWCRESTAKRRWGSPRGWWSADKWAAMPVASETSHPDRWMDRHRHVASGKKWIRFQAEAAASASQANHQWNLFQNKQKNEKKKNKHKKTGITTTTEKRKEKKIEIRVQSGRRLSSCV